MAFKKLTKLPYPPRLWALVGYPGGGKSTFATRMRGPILTVDADHRFTEVAHLAADDIFKLSDNPDDNNNSDAVARILDENMPGSGVKTIVVDSLTAIISPMVMKALRDNDAGANKNRAAAFKDKATAMRQLQFAVSKWGVDTLWIYHLQDGRDDKGKEVVTATLPRTERNRLHSSLNMELHVVIDGDRRGIKVVWARSGRYGMTLWDEGGMWRGMPERIEQAVYDGLSEDDKKRLATEAPAVFPSVAAAIDWSVQRGAFDNIQHAQNAYDKTKREGQPGNAKEMRDLWVNEVKTRIELLAHDAAQVSQPEQPGY